MNSRTQEAREARGDYLAGIYGATARELYDDLVLVLAKAIERVPFYKVEGPARRFLEDLKIFHEAVLERIEAFENGDVDLPARRLPPMCIDAYEKALLKIAEIAA